MSFSKEGQIFAHFETRTFLKLACAEGAHLIEPSNPNWIRDRNITGAYFSSQGTYKDVAAAYAQGKKPLSHSRIGQIITWTIQQIHANSSPELQKQFPLEKIQLSKPRSLRSRQRISQALGGVSLSIAAGLEEGMTIQEAAVKAGLSEQQATSAKPILESWGYPVPHLKKRLRENRRIILGLKDLAASTEQLQELLNLVNLGLYRKELTSDDPAISRVMDVIRQSGFKMLTRDFAEFIAVLESSQTPFRMLEKVVKTGAQQGIQRYYFIARQNTDLAIQAFLNSPQLQRFRIR
ncbi:hypothetical protein HY025_01400 [Candidatus Daviesbacteria bacterium]|nr:hypothetical protein [Candidatus Daviesbacteria bacterium]